MDAQEKIVITSNNPVKISVVQETIAALFPGKTIDLVSQDLEQGGAEPVGEQAIIFQITDGIQRARTMHPDALYYVGMEGGIIETAHDTNEAAYVIIEDALGTRQGISQSVSFCIPPTVAKLVKDGVPFGDAVDQIFGTNNIKIGQGFIGLLTNGLVDKKALYMQPAIVAFSKILHEEWYIQK